MRVADSLQVKGMSIIRFAAEFHFFSDLQLFKKRFSTFFSKKIAGEKILVSDTTTIGRVHRASVNSH